MKRIVAFALSLIMVFTSMCFSYGESDLSKGVDSGEKGPKYEYQTIYDPPVFEDLDPEFPSGQDPGGVCMPSGGILYYNKNGNGPSISFGFTLPSPYNYISGSINIGTVNTTGVGIGVNIPADHHYYKLQVTKTVKIVTYTTYYRLKGSSDPWVYYSHGSGYSDYHSLCEPVQVD
jgi:hypothetical protein